MTDPEITALAREYAEDATKTMVSDPNLSDTDIKGIKRDIAEYAEEILRFLLRRFCLVEKSKVEQLKQCFGSEEVYEVIDMLFPDLGKEVES